MRLDLKSATETALETLHRHYRAALPAGGSSAPLMNPFKSNINVALNIGSIGVHDRWILTLKPMPGGAVKASMHDIDSLRDQEIAQEVHTASEMVKHH